jgi:hypothetical protein
MSACDYCRTALVAIVLLGGSAVAWAAEPPAINPFGPRPTQREDAVPGYLELSDGKVLCGTIYLTRDTRLKILDAKLNRQREIPLTAVRQIDCEVKREWMEKEWRFKELASDERLYTGRRYPSREYLHTIILRDGRKIKGPLSAIVYLVPDEDASPARQADRQASEPVRFMLHKREKGEAGEGLNSLVYVRSVKLGEDALKEGRDKARKAKDRSKSKGR